MLRGGDRDKAIIQRLDGWNRSNAQWPPPIETGIRLLRLGIEAQPRIGTPKPHQTRDAISSLLMQGKVRTGHYWRNSSGQRSGS
jgi:hypothetical protein